MAFCVDNDANFACAKYRLHLPPGRVMKNYILYEISVIFLEPMILLRAQAALSIMTQDNR